MNQSSEKRQSVSKLMADVFTGQVSRRDVMKRGAALGLSAAVMGSMLRHYGAMAQDATPASAAVTLEDLRTDLGGVTITAIMGQDGPNVPWEDARVADFEAATGIKVNRISGAASATERLANYLQVLNAGTSDVDVLQIDVIWPGILASHAIDLSAAAAQNASDYFPAIMENNTIDGILVGIPYYTDAGIMYYRTDLLEKYGIADPPATWADLEAAAKTIQDGERAAGLADFWGYVWQGNAYEGLTCNGLEWQVSNGGGTIIEPDGTVSVDNDQVKAAVTRAAGWVNTISPAGVTTYQEEESRGVWQGGNAAFMRNWPYAYSLGNADDSPIKDKFAVVPVPMGDGEGARNADCLGGWQMMVSKYSEQQEAATEFARYMTSVPVQKSHAIEGSFLPTVASLYDDPAVLEAQPFFGQLKDVFTGGAVARPSTVSGEYYNDVSTAYFTALHQVLTGEQDADSAINDLAGQLQDIMDEKNA